MQGIPDVTGEVSVCTAGASDGGATACALVQPAAMNDDKTSINRIGKTGSMFGSREMAGCGRHGSRDLTKSSLETRLRADQRGETAMRRTPPDAE